MMKRIALFPLFAMTLLAVPTLAHAQHKSPLADAPAIRKRVELRSTRLELGVGFGSTINETFNHGLMAAVHAGFHITDWLAIGVMGAFNVAQLTTGFDDKLNTTLPADVPAPNTDLRAPTQDQAKAGMNKMAWIFSPQVEVTPFAGKFGMFGKLFAHYDFYIFAGPAFVNLAKANPNVAMTPQTTPITGCTDKAAAGISPQGETCVVTGLKIAPASYGGGFHAFFNNFLALNVEVRDLLFKDNPSGRDVNGDQHANNGDQTWTSHLMATIGLTVFLPAKADISP